MLAEILGYYISDELGKQILKKIPYCVAISLALYLVLDRSFASLGTWLLWVSGISTTLFLVSTALFLRRINGPMRNLFANVDLKDLVAKLRSIYEKGDSILADIDLSRSKTMLVSGIANGIAILILMTSVLLLFLTNSGIAPEIAAIAIMLALIYLVYDVAKSPGIEETEAGNKSSFGSDVLEKYTVTNTLQTVGFRSRGWLFLASRLIGPIVHISVPNFSSDSTLVYETPELVETLRGLTPMTKETGEEESPEKRDREKIFLTQEGGESYDRFLLYEKGDARPVTVLLDESPKKVFPYLLDPGSSEAGKGWIALAIMQTNPERKVGHVFIQKFSGVYVKTKIKQERTRQIVTRKRALQFVFFGERSYVQYIKNIVEINSARVPPSVLDKEFEP